MPYYGISGARAVTGGAAAGGAGLASTGVPFAVTNALMIALALIVLGGLLLVALRLLPRYAWEPIQGEDGMYRMRFTKNGRPRHRG
jgi:hypothetical protein